MYPDLPPLRAEFPQQHKISGRLVDAACCGFLWQRLVVKLIDVISAFFNFSGNYSRPAEYPIQERSTVVSEPVTPIAKPVSFTAPVAKEQDRPVMDDQSEPTAVVAKAKEKPVTQPTPSVSRRHKQPVRPKESYIQQQRRKKAERKQRRQEQRRQQYLECQDTLEAAMITGARSHKMIRQERKLAEKRLQQEIRCLMAIETQTDAEIEQRLFDDECKRLARIDVQGDVISTGRTREKCRAGAEAYQQQVARSIRIPDNDLLLAPGSPQDDYQKRVAELYQRLQSESYGRWQPLIGRDEFQICFAPLVSKEEELDMDATIDAFINFRKLQEIQKETDIEFPAQAFALLLEDGYLENDPREFEDEIRFAADLEPGFETIELNNAFRRKEHYIQLVEDFYEEFSDRLAESAQRLEKHMQFIRDKGKDELLFRQDSELSSHDELVSLEMEME